MQRRGGRKVNGTPVGQPVPQAIDDWTGFKKDLSELKLEWDGLYTVDPDIRNFQDFVRGVKDDASLPYSRPEAPNVFLAENLFTESNLPIMTETGEPLLTEGAVRAL